MSQMQLIAGGSTPSIQEEWLARLVSVEDSVKVPVGEEEATT